MCKHVVEGPRLLRRIWTTGVTTDGLGKPWFAQLPNSFEFDLLHSRVQFNQLPAWSRPERINSRVEKKFFVGMVELYLKQWRLGLAAPWIRTEATAAPANCRPRRAQAHNYRGRSPFYLHARTLSPDQGATIVVKQFHPFIQLHWNND